ncbi:hypothetical protein [Trinickia acidisoli]|uniref:hypothetical protein n=1 Tax=Trinickia acidisoli TaxID=2767482 RepID=UPI001A8D5CB7|nr:hypothetical protein [Trinickia acidisoli]
MSSVMFVPMMDVPLGGSRSPPARFAQERAVEMMRKDAKFHIPKQSQFTPRFKTQDVNWCLLV